MKQVFEVQSGEGLLASDVYQALQSGQYQGPISVTELDSFYASYCALEKKLEEAQRELYVTKNGLECAIRLKNLEIAMGDKELAHAKLNYWGMKLQAACNSYEKAKAISEGRPVPPS